MFGQKSSGRQVLSLLVIMLSATAAVRASETVEPGETQSFLEGDRCDFTPFVDTLLKGTAAFCLPPARVEAYAILSLAGFNNDVTAFATLFTDFSVTPGNEVVLGATVSATVDWDGVLFGAGILGAGASVKIEMTLVDDTTGTIKGSTVVMSKAQDKTGLKGIDIGGTRVSGSREISFEGSVVRGHSHSIQMKLTCSAESGLIGLDVGCVFFNDLIFGIDLGGDPHVKWTELSITVEQDLFERLDQIDLKLEGLDRKLNEVIRLLLTPQGRRSSDLIECDLDECDFPLRFRNGRMSRSR